MPSIPVYEFGSDAIGLHFTIQATYNGDDAHPQTTFDVHVITGALDLNALYWTDGDTTGKEDHFYSFTGAKSENALNMNGSNVAWADDGTPYSLNELYDGGIKLSDAGLGSTTKPTYLTADPSDTFPSDFHVTANVNINNFPILGVRATSTSTLEGSIKWVDEHPGGPTPPPEVCFDGLSQGAWSTPNSGAGDWTQTPFHTTDSYETVFGVDAHGNADGQTLLGVLTTAPGGNQELILGKQVVGALLNATSTGETDLTAHYRFSESDIIHALQECYGDTSYANDVPGSGGTAGTFNAVKAAHLQNLLQFWNNAPEMNTGTGATHPGELCSDDTTTLATTLHFNDGGTDFYGGSFTGGIIGVLNALHPSDGWV